MIYICLAFLIGIAAGLRALTAPTLVGWAARLGWLRLDGTWLAFFGYPWTPWILSLAAIGELVNDKLPQTPSRKTPPQFITRVLTGALSGAALTSPYGGVASGFIAGCLGAVVGTLGGAALRTSLSRLSEAKICPLPYLKILPLCLLLCSS